MVVGIGSPFTLARFSEAFLLLKGQASGLPLTLVPLVMVCMNVVYAAASTPAGALSDRVGRHGLLATGMAVLAVADIVLAAGPGLAGLLPARRCGDCTWLCRKGCCRPWLPMSRRHRCAARRSASSTS
ncbi:MAG: hypothetical protein ACJ8AI_06100 [Rhodopila sp.]